MIETSTFKGSYYYTIDYLKIHFTGISDCCKIAEFLEVHNKVRCPVIHKKCILYTGCPGTL